MKLYVPRFWFPFSFLFFREAESGEVRAHPAHLEMDHERRRATWQIEALERKNRGVHKQLAKKKLKNTWLHGERVRLQAEVDRLLEENRALSEQLERGQAMRSISRDERSDLLDTNAGLLSRVQELEAELEEANGELTRLQINRALAPVECAHVDAAECRCLLDEERETPDPAEVPEEAP